MSLDILSLDYGLSSMMIAVGGSIVVILISYLVYRIGIGKEKSFEEVLEEQKRRSIEEEMQQKLEKSKKEKKFKKSWGKKGKEKVEHDKTPELIQVEEKREVPHIEIIEPKEVKPTKQKNKNKSPKPEVHVAAEKPKKVEIVTVQEKHVPEKQKIEPEAIKELEKVKAEPKPIDVSKSKVEVSESASSSNVSVQVTSASNTSTNKKKKKEQVDKDALSMSVSKFLALIKESEFDTEEIQTLVDVLLNKQKDSTGWTKKNDQLATTKKNLQEKEQLLDQEQRQSQAVTAKLKDLREEYNLLKAKLTNQEKVSQEKISRQQQDIQAVTSRVKQVQDLLTAEKEKYSQLESDTEEKIATSMKKLEEENIKLQQKISELEVESQSGASKSEIEALKKSKDDLQKVHQLLVDQHTQLVAMGKSDLKNLNTQLEDVKADLEKVNAKNTALLKDKATFDLSKRTLEENLKAEQKHSADLEVQVQQLTAKVKDLNQLQCEIKELRVENERLTEQLVTTKERVAGDGQEIIHQNGELNIKAQEEDTLKSIEEKDTLLKEKETVLAQLNEELNKQKAKIAVLSDEIDIQKQKNNELREKNWKAMDALTNAEKSAEQKLNELQKTTDQKLSLVKKEYEDKLEELSNNAQSSVPQELSDKVKQAEDEAASRLSDYNSEIEKTKHLTSELDRISALEKSTEFRISEMEKTIEDLNSQLSKSQSKTKECLLRICPEVSVDSSLPYDEWLSEFEKLAGLAEQSVSSSTDKIIELQVQFERTLEEKQKAYLEKQNHYEKVLAETESTLHKLEECAESQEVIWKGILNEKELELKEALSERDALVAEKDTIQSTFQQISQLEELQEKLKLLQSTIENAESERLHLEQKYEEVNKNCINLRDQLDNKEKQIVELQNERSSVESLKQEVEELKVNLDKEKKISKDFSSQMVRLHSLVKIGQDSLAAEQEQIKKLKSQLETSQVSTANGTTSAAVQSPIINSEDASVKK